MSATTGLNPWVKQLITIVVIGFVAVGANFGLAKIIPDTAWRQLFMFAMVNVVVALSLNVINGMAGQFSIGHAGFVGIGAYTAAIVAGNLHLKVHVAALGDKEALEALANLSPANIPLESSFIVMPVAMIAASLVAGVFGLIVGLPSLRLKGDYLAIVTLGFSEIFRLVISSASGGAESSGLSGLIAKLGGQQGYAGPDERGVPQYAGPFWIIGSVMAATVVAWRLKFSGWGRALRALREDEIAAAAVGVDPTRYKVTSFVIAAMGGGFAGSLFALMHDGSPTVQPESFGFLASFDAITMVILGGSGSVSGAVVGGIFVTVTVKLIEQLQGLEAVKEWMIAHPKFDLNACRMVVYAAVLIGLMILRPAGLFKENEIFRSKRRARPKPPPEAPAPTAEAS